MEEQVRPVLKLVNISKKISEYFSLKNISLEVFKGEVHVIMGENGSGKSSLMNIVAGAYARDTGEILMDGFPVSISSPTDAKRLGITMIHQDSSLFEHFTVAENIFTDNKPYLCKGLKLINWRRLYSDCQELLDRLGFSLDGRSVVKSLSLAQKQLVEIAKAYLSNARIIIMDEPTSSLTDSEALLLFNIIKDLKKAGVSILYISHRLEEIRRIGDRVTVIRDGEIIGTQEIGRMDVDGILTMMTGMELKDRYPKLSVKTGREVLRVSDLYSGNTLKGVSFSVRRREILGITGLAGSGRTKIAKCIFGLDRVDAGSIFFENCRLSVKSPGDAIRAGIAYVTEDRSADGLFMYLNVPQNITAPNMGRISEGLLINGAAEKNIAEAYIKRLGIKIGSMKDQAASLSGGSQQKVVLAKWMMSRARLFIFDEPTRDIDIPSKVDVYNLMNEIAAKGASIILISSDVNEIIGMCDRVAILYGGRIAAVISRNEATQEKIMYYATGGHQDAER